ncbi:hypothetical protein PG994_004569 [Apiospora phragmitis]|uniref:VOC domain-containing protein n=1 Tax=Apiospora phragmitis TaxID=2905665 RepID=A0ABR1VU16_9PEZI
MPQETTTTAATDTPPATSMPPSILGLNHLKLASRNPHATQSFYTTVFPFTPLPHYDHHLADGTAAAQVGWDPVTWGVNARADLEAWSRWLDAQNVEHSRVLRGVKGWVLCARDPDGKIVRLYTEEEHEWSLPEEDEVWLGSLEDK